MTSEEYRQVLDRMDALSRAIARLAGRVESVERALSISSAPEPVREVAPAPPEPPPTPPPPPKPLTPALEPKTEPAPALESQLGLTWLNRIGVITLALGVAFLFKYAIDNEWIGPAGRVVIGILAGLGVLYCGDVLWRRGQRVYAQGITALGIVILYLSFYASFGLYHLVPVEFAFVLMALTTALGGLLSIRYNAAAIVVLAQLGGYLTPVVLSTGKDEPWVLFGWITLVNAGAIWVARRQKWQVPSAVALAGSAALFVAWFGEHFQIEKQIPASAFLLVSCALLHAADCWPIACIAQVAAATGVAAVYGDKAGVMLLIQVVLATVSTYRSETMAAAFAGFWVAMLYHLAGVDPQQELAPLLLASTWIFIIFIAWQWHRVRYLGQTLGRLDLTVLAANGVVYFAFAYQWLRVQYDGWTGLFTVAVAGAYALVGWLLWSTPAEHREKGRDAAQLTVLASLSFLTLAAPVQLSAWRITIAWVVEAVALAWIARKRQSSGLYVLSAVVLLLVGLRLLAVDLEMLQDPQKYVLLFNARFFVLLWSAAGFWFCARLFPRNLAAVVIYLAGHLTFLAALELEAAGQILRTVAPADAANYILVCSSVLASIYGFALVAFGVATRTVLNRIFGLVLLALVIAKLYLYDVWELGRLFRTTAFVALGLVLVLASYLYSRYRDKIAELLKDES